MKRAYPSLFRTIFNLPITLATPGGNGGQTTYHLNAIGNRFLLTSPYKVAVRLSRKLTESQINEQIEHYLRLADEGAVLISPAISPGEKRVMRAAFDNGYPAILVSSYGFNVYSKVGHPYHEACVAGRFLMISYFESDSKPEFNRRLCLELNDFTSRLCNG